MYKVDVDTLDSLVVVVVGSGKRGRVANISQPGVKERRLVVVECLV